eukprot:4690269-Alexandrium_andersonii.AAC.1
MSAFSVGQHLPCCARQAFGRGHGVQGKRAQPQEPEPLFSIPPQWPGPPAASFLRETLEQRDPDGKGT